MASKDSLIRFSVVFKKFGLIANEFLSVICQFLNVGIINFSLEFYISHFCNKAINGFCNSIHFICHTFYLIITGIEYYAKYFVEYSYFCCYLFKYLTLILYLCRNY